MLKRPTTGHLRTELYRSARVLGDVSAVRRGPRAIGRRILRRWVGRVTGRLLGRWFR